MVSIPRLSIITINLNDRSGLEKTIKSVINQTYTDYEFLIFDGGSTDGSPDIIAGYASKINYWISEPDRGIYHAMNKGVKEATGEYCLFLNSGDWLVNDNVLINIFSTGRNADILYGDCQVSKAGKVLYVVRPADKLTLKAFIRNTLPHQATFIKRTLFDTYGLYNECYRLHADYDYWLRTIIIGQCTTEKLRLLIVDYNMDGLSSDTVNNPYLHQEAAAIVSGYFPETVLVDYYDWIEENVNSMVILRWAKSQKFMYIFIELCYKIVKRLKRIQISL